MRDALIYGYKDINWPQTDIGNVFGKLREENFTMWTNDRKKRRAASRHFPNWVILYAWKP